MCEPRCLWCGCSPSSCHCPPKALARIKDLEEELRFELEIVRVDKDAEIAALEARVAEREDGMLQWKQRESVALTRVRVLEGERDILQRRLNWRGSDRLAREVKALLDRGVIDGRSPAADAILDYAGEKFAALAGDDRE